MRAPTSRLDFPGAEGDRLVGILHRPDGHVAGAVLIAPCFTCGKGIATASRLARAVSAAGYAALRFDFTGLGDSEGDFTEVTLTRDVGDVRAAVAALVDADLGPIAVLGHSLGGAAALLAAQSLPEVRAVAVLAAPSSTDHARRRIIGNLGEEIEREGSAVLSAGGRDFRIGVALGADLDHHDVRGAVMGLDRPLLVLHGSADTVVELAEGEAIHAFAAEPKRLAVIDGADHILSDRDHAAEAGRILVDWLGEVL
jgi:pimeloyl-ACP methyl ester carboxylesterase